MTLPSVLSSLPKSRQGLWSEQYLLYCSGVSIHPVFTLLGRPGYSTKPAFTAVHTSLLFFRLPSITKTVPQPLVPHWWPNTKVWYSNVSEGQWIWLGFEHSKPKKFVYTWVKSVKCFLVPGWHSQEYPLCQGRMSWAVEMREGTIQQHAKLNT